MSQSFVRVCFDVIFIALAGSIGKLFALNCTDDMLKLMDVCGLSFMSSLLDNCKETTQCNKGHIQESTDKNQISYNRSSLLHRIIQNLDLGQDVS
jgi:hypothetical protein